MRTSDTDFRRTRTDRDEHQSDNHERPLALRSPLLLTRRATLGVLALAGYLASGGVVMGRAQEDDDRIAELEREVEQLTQELAEIREEVAELSVTVDDEAVVEAVFVAPGDEFLEVFRAGSRGETAAFQSALGEGLFVLPGDEFLDPIRTGEAREFLTALGEGLEELGIISPNF